MVTSLPSAHSRELVGERRIRDHEVLRVEPDRLEAVEHAVGHRLAPDRQQRLRAVAGERVQPGGIAGREHQQLHPTGCSPPDAVLGDDGVDELRRRDVERRVERRKAGGDLVGAALLDRNRVAVERVGIDRGRRCDDDERDVVMACEHGEPVRADLVGGVAVRRDAVGAGERDVDATAAISDATALSAITENGMPSRSSSQAVSREPWSSGRVSVTQTCSTRPRS